jgi:hypothetical protein
MRRPPYFGQKVHMSGAAVIASLATAAVVVLVLGAFIWAAREDGRDQRRRDASQRLPRRRRAP